MSLYDLHCSIADADLSPRLPYSFDPSEPLEPQKKRADRVFRSLLGYDKMPVCSDAPEVRVDFVTDDDPRFTETRFQFESEPGFFVPVHLLIPKVSSPFEKNGRLPVMICLQGHSTGMHISIGRAKFPGDEATIAGGRDFAIQAVSRGYIAIAMEQRGLGELKHGSGCLLPASQALLLGRTLLGERIYDIGRLIDALESGLSDAADTGRIYLMGNSGGGTATWHAAAIEHRLSAVMPSCAFNLYRKSIFAMDHCICNHIPHILEYMEMPDLAMLTAPTPVVIVCGKEDGIFPLDGVEEGFETVRSVYSAAGIPDACRLVIGPAGHRFYPDEGWPVFEELTAKYCG
jgi:dienelactone hydrolase